MTKRIEGQRFGRLLVVKENGRSTDHQVMWLCQCDCGATTTVRSRSLRTGHTRSCGCLWRQAITETHFRHGESDSSIHGCWMNMRRRCGDPTNKAWKYYGARGISVCERWLSFDNFLADMGQKPSAKHSIDRINNDGNYEPGNCRWATASEQRLNSRKPVRKVKA